jgi:hypothetical protein
MKLPAIVRRLPRWARRLLVGSGILVLLYAVAGFLVAPAVLKARLPGTLSRLLGRTVSVRQVRLNPFTLTASVEGFAVKERDGSDFMGWERLRVRLGLATLVTRSVAFDRIELTRPYGQVIVERGGQLNYADILARLASGGPATAPAPKGEPRTLRIGRLSIEGARVTFLDRGLAEPFGTVLGPVSLELTGFSTGLDSRNPYTFEGRTEAGESFRWNGTFSLSPLASQGSFALDRLKLPKYHPFYRDQVEFDLQDGVASLQADYTFRWSEGAHVMRLAGGSLDLQDLKLGQGRSAPALELPRVAARGIEADLVARSARCASLGLDDGRVQVTRAANGELSLVRLLTPKPAKAPKEPAAPFRFQLDELRLKGFKVDFQDQGTVRPVRILAEDLDATLRGFSLDPSTQARLELSLKLNGAAGISAEGMVAPLRPALDLALKVDRLALPAFDPYLAPATDIRLNRGSLSLQGRLSGVFEGRPGDRAGFRGSLRLDGFEAADGARGEPFLGYRSLVLSGLELRTNPDSVAIRSVDLVEPSPRLVVAPDGSTNVARALKLETPAPGQAPPSPPLSALGSAVPPGPARPLKLTITRTRMTAGRLSFVDRSVEPSAALLITGLEGSATSLSSEADSQSSVDFKGLAGGLAPLRVLGRAMPLRKDQDTDVTVTIQGSELTDFSPYAGKFLGYTIRKGKLDVDARVRIQQRQLDALVKTRMDQLYLGDKVESPDASKLPVRLALAILRDRRGVIDLELPVTGNLDDPDLHYGRIILHAIVNVLTKVVTSPFSLLARLGGGQDQDLSYVAFAAGSAAPDPVAVTKAQALARALAERPGLSLEAEGCADASDAGALKEQALEQSLLRLKAGGTPAAGASLSSEERARLLQVAYRRAFPAPAAATPPPPPAEMEQRLLGTLEVSADDLRQLAAARAKALIKLLLDDQVDPGRLFAVTGGERAAKEGGSRVYFGLK